jgi:hypothetical protein
LPGDYCRPVITPVAWFVSYDQGVNYAICAVTEMATQFVLPCACGEKHTIAKTQAGQELACKCGAKLEVPTIRKMEQLQPLDRTDDPKPWSRGQGGLFVAGIFVLIAGTAATMWLIRQTPSLDLDNPQLLADWNLRSTRLSAWHTQDTGSVARVAARWNRDFDQLTAAQALGLWSLHRDLGPFMLQVAHDQRKIEARRTRNQSWTWAVAGLAVVVGGGLIGAALVRRP